MKMPSQTAPKARFEKVGECLYRYSSNGVYYALLKNHGKQKRQSLETTDKAFAKRKLADLKNSIGGLDAAVGRVTLGESCVRYMATVQNQKPRTIRRKRDIIQQLLSRFPGGANAPVSKIRPSHLEGWLASYTFGYASQNLYLQAIKGIFDLCVQDRIIAESPAANIKAKKRTKPVRLTPSWEEFWRIIEDVRHEPLNADSEDSGNFLEFMGLAGVGQAEIGRLVRADIDFRGERLRLYRVKTSTPFQVPLYPQLLPLLDRMGVASMPPEQRVFVLSDAKKALSASCKRLGMPAYSQRSLRRMFITRCIELGIDVKVISEWQGHQDGGKLILATYSHVRKTHADEMAKKLTLN